MGLIPSIHPYLQCTSVLCLHKLLKINATKQHFPDKEAASSVIIDDCGNTLFLIKPKQLLKKSGGHPQFSLLLVRQTTQVNAASIGQGSKVNYGE